jgi:hypothetical protein
MQAEDFVELVEDVLAECEEVWIGGKGHEGSPGWG